MRPSRLPMCSSVVTMIVRSTVAFAALTAVVGTAPPAALAQVDHFTCYKARTTSQTARFITVPGVSLVDALGSSSVDVKRSRMLCAPTNKNGEDPTAPSHPDHLEDYQTMRPAFTAILNQKVTDQFGTIFVDLRKPVSLQVPTAKSHTASPAAPTNPAVDHFQCYKVRTSANSARFVTIPGVTIQDQFGTMTVDVKRPRRLCLPANKRNEEPGAENHPDHLMCYGIKQTSQPLFTTQSPLFINNQFGPLTLDAKRPLELCVPALRNPGATPTATPIPDTPTPTAGTPTAGTPTAGTPTAGTPTAGTPTTGTPTALSRRHI
jgi:hypothetical protein